MAVLCLSLLRYSSYLSDRFSAIQERWLERKDCDRQKPTQPTLRSRLLPRLHVKDYRSEHRNILCQLHRVTTGFAINEQIVTALVADEG